MNEGEFWVSPRTKVYTLFQLIHSTDMGIDDDRINEVIIETHDMRVACQSRMNISISRVFRFIIIARN